MLEVRPVVPLGEGSSDWKGTRGGLQGFWLHYNLVSSYTAMIDPKTGESGPAQAGPAPQLQWGWAFLFGEYFSPGIGQTWVQTMSPTLSCL